MLIFLKKPGIDEVISINPAQVSAVDYDASRTQCYVYVNYRPFSVQGTVEDVTNRINEALRHATTASLSMDEPCRGCKSKQGAKGRGGSNPQID